MSSDPRTTSSIFTRGAIDLSSLRTPPPPPSAVQPAASAATAAAPGGGVTVIDVTEATFQTEVLERSMHTPVVIDFWAEWCGPCKMIAPVLEDIAKEHGGQVAVAKLNVDDNPEVARRYDVMSIPTLLVFADGQVKRRLVGAKGKAQLLV